MNECPFQIGDIIARQGNVALVRTARVTEIRDDRIVAQVIDGDDLRNPLTVYRAGWFLYKVTQRNQ